MKRGDFGKRGVSAVVATVLIIMITVAAVGIVWAVIIPMIKDNLGGSVACNDADVTIGTSQGYTCYDAAQKVVGVQTVKGVNNVNVSGLRIFASSSGSSVSYSTDFNFEKSSSRIFYINVSTLTGVDEVSVVPVLTDGRSSKECSKVSLKTVPGCTFTQQELALVAQTNMLIEKDCSAASDCEDRLCSSKSCNSGTNKCEYTNFPASTICSTGRCDGGGNCVTQCTDDTQCDVSGLCGFQYNNTCQAGACIHTDKPCTAYTESFENGENGWSNTVIYQDWWSGEASYWEISSSDANDGSYSFSLKQHPSRGSERIDSPIIDLSSVSEPILEYYHKYHFDDCGTPGSFVPDGVVVEVYNENGRMIISPTIPQGYPLYITIEDGCAVPGWYQTPVFSANTGGEWQLARFDLSSAVAALGNNLGIGFETQFDCGNCEWRQEVYYLDNIRIGGLG
jgi:hypothetical protein